MKEQRFDSIWEAIETSPAEAANMKARAELMTAVRDAIEGWRLTQSEAAGRLEITQPRLNDLLRGRIGKFSLDALMNLTAKAGLSVRIEVLKPAA